MKLSLKKTCILLVVAAAVIPQNIAASASFDNKFVSAQVTDMFRYGDTETSLFTGNLQVSIPIYSLDDPDFDLNIILRYNAEGFKPRKHSGYVGYSWFLEAGGCITREVRNYADETCRYDQQSGKYMMGMLNFINRNPANKLDKESVLTFASSAGTTCSSGYDVGSTWNIGDNCIADVDYLPDVFHFNFCGYQGSFIIDNAGLPKIISGDYMKIDISDLTESDIPSASNTNLTPKHTTSITLTSKEGYKFVFGGDLSSVGYSISLLNARDWAVQYHPIINAWHLKKIVAPNMRQILFHYKQPEENVGYIRQDSLLELNEYHDLFANNSFFTQNVNSSNTSPNPNSQAIRMNMTRISVLDSIVVSGEQPLRILCYNHADEKSLYNHGGHYGIGDRPCMLDSIHIVSSDRTIRKAALSYEYQLYDYHTLNYAHYWRFLKNVIISGVGTYTLSYNYEPGMFQNLIAETGFSYDQVVDYYGYSVSHPLGGMLCRIDYPTGGRQEFTYQHHTCGKERRFVIGNNQYIVMETNSASLQIPGARISEIRTYSTSADTSPIEVKQYSYIPAPFAPFSYSSGVYYNNRLLYFPNGNNEGLLVTDENAYSMLNTHIGYAYVEETTKDENNVIMSKVGYTFDIGRDSYIPSYNIHPNWYAVGNNNYYAALSGMLAYNSILTKAGHLVSKDYYDNDDLIRSECYIYNGIDASPYHLIPVGKSKLGCTDTIAIFSHRAVPITRALYVYPDVMEQHVTHDYSTDGPPLFLNRCYVYDKKLRVKREYIGDSQNRWLFNQYSYPDEYLMRPRPLYLNARAIPSPFGAIWTLYSQHRINIPLEIISGFEDINANEYITSGKLNIYESYTKSFSLDSIVSYACLSRTMELSISSPVTDYNPLVYNFESPSYDIRYRTTCEYLFDSSLRLIRKSPCGQIPITYTWNGIYPASQTIGNQTISYTFIPHVGVSSITDSRGVTTYYSYDDQGRLKETYQIINGVKQIININLYHIKTE